MKRLIIFLAILTFSCEREERGLDGGGVKDLIAMPLGLYLVVWPVQGEFDDNDSSTSIGGGGTPKNDASDTFGR